MFSHVMVGANDIEKSKAFYDAALMVLGYKEGVYDQKGRVVYIGEDTVFMLTKPINGEPASHGNGMTIGFKANSPELADAWFEAGKAQGGEPIENPPGVRQVGKRQLYLAYLRDPSGNKVCVTHVMPS
ncbi:VOC family protein [Marinomonas piezotolerans]|uniref:VOC family protein n=1 Tax=Marinomonas piezotolerans TaxID=2213058 RepID=A0A370UBU3_9GAMM|nr:VOC family protein [Marinomonas piezotolerans]RDL45277.1 VOC family protein [Marinomonas piezotolerans]